MTNARKHSGAHIIRINIDSDKSRAHISVADDGRGFDTSRLNHGDGSHFGLVFMRERMDQISGSVNIDSIPGPGPLFTWMYHQPTNGEKVMKVLLVDDNRLMLEGLQNLLERTISRLPVLQRMDLKQ